MTSFPDLCASDEPERRTLHSGFVRQQSHVLSFNRQKRFFRQRGNRNYANANNIVLSLMIGQLNVKILLTQPTRDCSPRNHHVDRDAERQCAVPQFVLFNSVYLNTLVMAGFVQLI